MEALKGLHATFRGLFDRLEVRLKQDRKQAEDDLEAHFHAVETVLFQTALPSISPRVKYSLQRFCDVSALLAALRQPEGDGREGSRSKLEVWQDLKVLSFARAAAAIAALTVVSVQMRLMLTVLSRQLFLERAMEGVAGDTRDPPLGIEAQEFFLSLVERGFVTTGMGTMVEALKATAATVVGDLALAETMDASRTRATFAALGEKVALRVRRGDFFFVSEPIDERDSKTRTKTHGWRDALLPPDETVVSAFRERFGAGADDASLALLLTMAREVRTVASTRVFAEALGGATARAWDRFAADAEASLFRDGGDETDAARGEVGAESVPKKNKLPVAKLVPAVSNLAGQTLSHPNDAFGAVASCPKVQELTREMW